MSHSLLVLEHGNISGGEQGLGARALREALPEETLTKAASRKDLARQRGMKWSGAHGNLKDCQGLKEVRE